MKPFDRISLAVGKFVLVSGGCWIALKTIQLLNQNVNITINVDCK